MHLLFIFYLCIRVTMSDNTISLSASLLPQGDILTVNVTRTAGYASPKDWIGITVEGNVLDGSPASLMWEYVMLDDADMGSVSFDTIELSLNLVYDVYYLKNDGYDIIAGPVSFELSSAASLFVDKSTYETGETIVVAFSRPSDDATRDDWISVTHRDSAPPSVLWQYVCGGIATCTTTVSSGHVTFPADSLSSGDYDVSYFHNNGYELIAGPVPFSVFHPDGDPSCRAAERSPSVNTHLPPTEGAEASTVAFSSCYKPHSQASSALWEHMRVSTQPDLFVWLGDNMYADGTDMESKRAAYNAARDDLYYATHGPVAEPKISVMGTWDDHDFGANNQGNDYECVLDSQREFAIHFNLPPSDPRHPDQGASQRRGVYSANMFARPAAMGGGNGMHVINLDARSGRDPTFSYYGPCKGASSRMLDDEQWAWLDEELSRPSAVKIISSGTQVLPPTDQTRSLTSYCAYDGTEGLFDSSIAAVDESASSVGTAFESWGEIPQERTRLLQKCQKAINDGYAQVRETLMLSAYLELISMCGGQQIVFISGDQHWAELMAKRMPSSAEFGPSVTLYEVTASGIDQWWNEDILNANRLRVRTADYRGDGVFDKECNFPFIYDGVSYNECTMVDEPALWCSIKTDISGQHVSGEWGYCLDKSLELAQETWFSNEETCSDQVMHVCTAQANYGAISVDWVENTLSMTIFTPHEDTARAAAHTIYLGDGACPPHFSATSGAGCVYVHLQAGNRNSGRDACELFGEGLAEVRDEVSGEALSEHLRNTLSVDAAFWHPNKRRGPYIALQWSGTNSRWEWPNGDPLGPYAPWRAGDGGTPTRGRNCVMTTYDGSWASTRCRSRVWAVCSAARSPSSQYRIIESSHPYANDERTRKTVAFPGSSCYRVKFYDTSSTHSKRDALKVYATDLATGTNTLIKKYHSGRWRDFSVQSDAVTFVFKTDTEGTDYGYKLQLRECNNVNVQSIS